jgi:D-alanine transaminase
MSRVAYVDGQYLPHRAAAVHIKDRGYQFADGVYEVMAAAGSPTSSPHLVQLARSLYVQVSRGVRRDHAFPKPAQPVLVVTSRRKTPVDPRAVADGIAAITIPNIRWQRWDIKSISLPPNVLGKERAREAAACEAWQVDHDGRISEGTSTNAWIVTSAAAA